MAGKPALTQSGAAVELRNRLEQAIKSLEWVAERVHQAYHQDHPGSWRDCDRQICDSVRYEIRRARGEQP